MYRTAEYGGKRQLELTYACICLPTHPHAKNHTQVRKFAAAIAERTNGRYGTACEHVHSCCTLLARTDVYLRDGKWQTWINYPRFHALLKRYHATGGEEKFSSADYMAETPAWAVWGAEEGGFDPIEVRFRRTKTKKKTDAQPLERPPIGLPPSRTKAEAKKDDSPE